MPWPATGRNGAHNAPCKPLEIKHSRLAVKNLITARFAQDAKSAKKDFFLRALYRSPR
jgi:hypothetical protein